MFAALQEKPALRRHVGSIQVIAQRGGMFALRCAHGAGSRIAQSLHGIDQFWQDSARGTA